VGNNQNLFSAYQTPHRFAGFEIFFCQTCRIEIVRRYRIILTFHVNESCRVLEGAGNTCGQINRPRAAFRPGWQLAPRIATMLLQFFPCVNYDAS